MSIPLIPYAGQDGPEYSIESDPATARNATRRRNIEKRRTARVERLERLLIRSLYALGQADLYLELINDIREELNRGPEDRLKSAPSRVCREGKAAVAAFQGGEGIDGISAIDSTP